LHAQSLRNFFFLQQRSGQEDGAAINSEENDCFAVRSFKCEEGSKVLSSSSKISSKAGS
jgi:hypothetical protein